MNVDFFDGIIEQLREIYESSEFPIIWLGGFIVMAAVSSDPWWLAPGIGGFAYWLLWKRSR